MALDVRFDEAHGTLRLQRPHPGVVLMTLVGVDTGEFGRAPFVALEDDLAASPVEIFIDARHGRAASAAVSGEWAMFFHANRARIGRVHMLTSPGSPAETAALVRSYGMLEDRMDLVTDAAQFERSLGEHLRAR